MGNPSSTDLPTGDLQSMGLSPRRMEIPAEDISEQDVQQTEPQEEATPEAAETPQEEAAPESASEDLSVLDQYTQIVAEEPVEETPIDPALATAQKEIEQLKSQLEELVSSRDEQLVEKASAAESTDDDIDLTSPVIKNYVRELRSAGNDEEADRVEARIIEEKIKQETAKSTAAISEKLEAAETETRMKQAIAEAEAAVKHEMDKAAKLGGVEAEIVSQFINTPPEKRPLTILGEMMVGNPRMLQNPASVYDAIRSRAADINDKVRRGPKPTPEPVDESTGITTRSKQKSVEINQQDEALTPEEIELQENEAFADELVSRNKLPEGLEFLKPL